MESSIHLSHKFKYTTFPDISSVSKHMLAIDTQSGNLKTNENYSLFNFSVDFIAGTLSGMGLVASAFPFE